MIYTTFKKLREAEACKDRYALLKSNLKNRKDNDPIRLIEILDSNGLNDVLWIPKSALIGPDIEKRYRLFAVACCQDILHLIKDQRSRDAVKIAHLFAYGEATKKDLTAAGEAAWVTAWVTAWATAWAAAREAAGATAGAAARAAARAAAVEAAVEAAGEAAWEAREAAGEAAWEAREAAREVAREAAWKAAWAAAGAAAWAKQTEHFKVIFSADFDD
jgi:hypothetical protein